MYVVQVTLGNGRLRQYASVPSRIQADKLRTAAKKRGYRDAKVVTAADFQAATGTNVWGQTHQESLDWEARRARLHGVRSFSRASLATAA